MAHPRGASGRGRGAPPVIRVVLVDRHDVVRRGLSGVLGVEPGIRVVGEATTVAQARRRVASLHPHVVLTDTRFPDGGAVDLCREVRAASPRARVVVVTACTDPEVVYEAVLAGAVGYLLVEVRPAVLVDAVRRVAAGQSLLDPAVTGRLLDRLRRPGVPSDLEGHPELEALTVQERRILALIVDGLTNREIGEMLRLSEQTVKNHVTGLLAKLGVARRTQAAAVGARLRRRASGPSAS
jgi:DNA-binding NarL/FixJ family response regulator